MSVPASEHDIGVVRPALAPHLLVVDDDARLRSVLGRYLQREGFQVAQAANAAQARSQLELFEFDLVILDVMMPTESGLSLLVEIRQKSRLPVLMLTAMAEPGDRVAGLEGGADDYLTKPFEPRELLLRLRNILTRSTPAVPAPPRELGLGSCRLDLVRGELSRNGERVHLTGGESALLLALAAQPNQPLSREALVAFSQFAGNERAVDVQITRLRRKIEVDQRFPRYLQTVRGMGYVLKPD
jgi:two-component system phosphate regulon response regulator OmpR